LRTHGKIRNIELCTYSNLGKEINHNDFAAFKAETDAFVNDLTNEIE